jgi:cytochrome c
MRQNGESDPVGLLHSDRTFFGFLNPIEHQFYMNIIRLKRFSWPLAGLFLLLGWSCSENKQEPRILVFSKTSAFRHESIGKGIEALRLMGQKHHFAVDTTENSDRFNEENLGRYSAVVFLSTTGDVLNQEQQNSFERYIQAGGGYVGIHAAADTEYDWPWYGQLVGAYFESHPLNPNVKSATFYTVDKTHMASDSLPDRFERTDEFYSYKNISPDIKVLVKIDEKTYTGGTNGDDHPMAWYHDFDGGRAFYTEMGHTDETYVEPLFLRHLWGGLNYAMGGEKPKSLDYKLAHTKRLPEENRFTKVVLEERLTEPVELAVLPDLRVLFVERRGNVKIYDPKAGKSKVIATIPVSTKYKVQDGNQAEAEDGLLGVSLDPNYAKNNWIYFYYSPAGEASMNVLARYELKGDELVESSKKIILEVMTQREQCCHTGGSITFDGKGNLFVSTGDNTSPRSTAYAPMDNRPGRSPWDAQKSSANTNDLRGKVLRIHPEDNGTYTVPDGNLFPKGTPNTRPEIYTMGARNPYRISVDKETGFLYWGDVGPDAGKDSVNRGPRAYDEINQARKAGFYGWPYFVGDNQAFYERDFKTNKAGAIFDPNKPINNSPNNTGLKELPPAQKAFIWYPYDVSKEFPLVGKGGRTAMAGPVYHSKDFAQATRPFPDYYDGKLFIYEWMRGWIMAVTMDGEGNYVAMEHFMPNYKFSNPMDMEFAPDGDLYMLEYGTGWFQGNDDARLVRIEYNGDNRKPFVRVASDRTKGAVPMKVNFSSKGTKDFDRDELAYEWDIQDEKGASLATLKEADPTYTFEKVGSYKAVLTVTDKKGAKSTAEIQLVAGNEPPALTFDINSGNKSFFFPNQTFAYEVKVDDKEDGSLASGGISPDQVAVTIDYLKDGYDKIEIAQGHAGANEMAQFATGKKLMEQSDCKSCHMLDKKSIGPMYADVARKYKDDPKAIGYLVKKVITGGGGVWGETAMAAHPQLSESDATEIIRYVLSIGTTPVAKSLPVKGTYTVNIPKGVPDQGAVILRASYTDKGANGMPSATSEQTTVLKSASFSAATATKTEGVTRYKLPSPPIELLIGSGDKSYFGFDAVDLTGIDQVMVVAMAPVEQVNAAGGKLEIHIDSPTGPLIGESTPIVPTKGKLTQPQPIMATAKLQPTTGMHEVYFVLRNEKAAGGILFIVTNVVYMSGQAGKGPVSMR